MIGIPALTAEDVADLDRLRCLRWFWKDNPRATEGQALVYWRALEINAPQQVASYAHAVHVDTPSSSFRDRHDARVGLGVALSDPSLSDAPDPSRSDTLVPDPDARE